MIHGFKDNKTTTAEEWLIDYSLKTGNSIDINTDLLDMPIKFDGKEVDAFILDIFDNRLVIQLALPIVTTFDGKSNRYETSYVRRLINSNEFLSRFNPEFVKHGQQTTIHTEEYVTTDKLWLLSHEEINRSDYRCSNYLRPNHECYTFEMFKTIDLEAYSRVLLKNKDAYGWRLRSAYSSPNAAFNSLVGSVNEYGYVNYYGVIHTDVGALFPVCTIC